MAPFTESNCDICDAGMYLCVALVVWIFWRHRKGIACIWKCLRGEQ